ncbi:Enoyl-ACP reductase-like protein OS=Eoetvoesiella caeni OX=645616 GN=DFR37_105250 PE=4 SV=1 [Eoetvoesiella caeni]
MNEHEQAPGLRRARAGNRRGPAGLAVTVTMLSDTSCGANLVVYVCSEQASGTTGAALRVDGGVLRQIA